MKRADTARLEGSAERSSPVKKIAGTVMEILPRALYRVTIDGGYEVTAHASAGPGRNFVRLVVGDRVTVELSPRDQGRGRITRKGT